MGQKCSFLVQVRVGSVGQRRTARETGEVATSKPCHHIADFSFKLNNQNAFK